jgi:hypothetical protein
MSTARFSAAHEAGRIPRLAQLDSSFTLLRDPYRFIGNHCRAARSPVFETRLMLKPTLCMSGARAAELFYDPTRFQRENAAPGLAGNAVRQGDVAEQLMLLSIDMLLRHMRFDVPEQDLTIAMDRLPAIPRHGFVVERVRPSA